MQFHMGAHTDGHYDVNNDYKNRYILLNLKVSYNSYRLNG